MNGRRIMTDITELQEAPAGKPWESDEVARWEPAPFNLAEYNKYAAGEVVAQADQPADDRPTTTAVDPLLTQE